MTMFRRFVASGPQFIFTHEVTSMRFFGLFPADQCLKETRTISHLLHPPLLDEAGLESALRWYIDGFGQRSGIKVNVNVPLTSGDFAGISKPHYSVLSKKPSRTFIGSPELQP